MCTINVDHGVDLKKYAYGLVLGFITISNFILECKVDHFAKINKRMFYSAVEQEKSSISDKVSYFLSLIEIIFIRNGSSKYFSVSIKWVADRNLRCGDF